jgi:phage baseplate assembly protein gpV
MSDTYGAIAAKVVEVDAEYGRVRVEYQTIEDGLESPWAYVAAPLAGSGRGMLFMPVKGDEVLVLHGDNDFDHPYVLGYLWNGEHKSPETDPKLRVIKTPGGHQLRFEDVDNKKKIVLKSDGGRRLTLDDNPSFGKVELVSGSNSVLMDDKPGATVVKLQAGSGVGVTVTLSATPQPSLSISVGAGTTIDLDASGLRINSPGSTSITVAGSATLTCSTATVNAAAMTLNAPALSVNSGIATFSGVVQCSTLIASAVVSPLYTPGIGNFI